MRHGMGWIRTGAIRSGCEDSVPGIGEGHRRREELHGADPAGEKRESEVREREDEGKEDGGAGSGDLGRRRRRSSPARRHGWSPVTRRPGSEALRCGICSVGARACGRAGPRRLGCPGPRWAPAGPDLGS